jgi:tetraacyldisaccharide 4'-kinase
MPFLEPGRPARRWLLGPAALYGAAARLRNWGYDRGWFTAARLPCPVISVGNVTVGGTGKTPVVILLVEWLQAEGRRVAVLSRGYRRTGSASPLLVSDGARLLAGPSEAGDEPFVIARRCPGAVVAVGSDRAALGRWVLERLPVDCFILDDGFQHRRLHRDVDLVLLDATDAGGLDALLPAGRLREPLSGLARAGSVMITRADSRDDVEAVQRRVRSVLNADASVEVIFRAESLVSVPGEARRDLGWGKGKTVWLVSGVGNSGSFARSARSLGFVISGETAFRDHHHYGAKDVREIGIMAQAAGAELVLTTEKDAGKLAPLLMAGDNWWALRIAAVVTQVEARLRDLVSRGVEG